MSVWQRIDERSVMRAWAIAEATSGKEKFAQFLAHEAPSSVRTKLLRREPETLTPDEWQFLEESLRLYRGPLIKHLLELGVEWCAGHMLVAALADMRFLNVPAWVAKAPSRAFGDLIGTRHLEGQAPEFRGFSTTIERPIAVGPNLLGPLCLLEGYTRCGAILRDRRAGLSDIERVPMIVGICPRVAEWTNGHGHRWW
jgi:hypothetical protein